MALPAPDPIVANQVVKVVVQAKAFDQQVQNSYFYIAVNALAPGANDVFVNDILQKFLQGWRVNILPLLTTDYTVQQYWGARIQQVHQILNPPLPTRYKTDYGQQSIVAGDIVLDQGAAAAPAAPLLDAMTVRKIPVIVNRFPRSSDRYSPLAKAELDPTETSKWKVTTVATWLLAVGAIATSLTDPAWKITMNPTLFSTATASAMGIPVLFDFRGACQSIQSVLPQRNVRSQVSRKLRNNGT